MKNKTILVTGASGQLGNCIRLISDKYKFNFLFKNSKELDITNKEKVVNFFEEHPIDFVINCAAYTNVEQAEKEPEKAFLINAEGTRNIAESCKKNKIVLIHISTDYVFGGKGTRPYLENDIPNPINEYGKSKLKGEEYIRELMDTYFIIRTSWLYSQFGHNFFKTILKKSETEKKLTITTGEIGTPTNANDLANFILAIIKENRKEFGIYHYSNQGQASWYDFAKEIIKVSGKLDNIVLIKTDNYPTFAKRPKYSVLGKGKIMNVYSIILVEWKNSLKSLINDFS
ncbi:dTDP-4-dehydrorhamnose reductase [Aquimarina sp. TRL1]|uniref:dTDP-4-dehydrorhamnose reductase n=1 Tax=Aquimarina sp. (strain TRL1) TaxID=2736252 RepID=UPI00158EB465|nr:dTDP-4-dehydrorhamnose reductase [Aquimarina sp. TRL1]QKX04710.1 dTDP-4-dehydrorhamnose reductase [Aquimarina sp. TRL1]